jgi:uncharacterized glyoxalase superfamily protein PhnB
MTSNRSAPAATVVPILIYADVGAAIAWLCAAFGVQERLRVARGGIVVHAQLLVGDGAIMLGRAGGPYQPPPSQGTSSYVHVQVDDVDAHHDRAVREGARTVTPLTDMPFGERQYTASDPEGHWWTFSQHIADVAPESWGATVAS